MKTNCLPLGDMQTNAYILEADDLRCIIIDPGAEPEKVSAYLTENQLRPLAILLTHTHFDHIGAVDQLRETYQIPMLCHENEQDWLGDPVKNSSHLGRTLITVKPADRFFTKEETLEMGPFQLAIIETPGHSPGGVSFYCKEIQTVFSGDTLFLRSIGRSDFYGGDHLALVKSNKEKLLKLPSDTIVLPGHGSATTIGDEQANNPFLQR